MADGAKGPQAPRAPTQDDLRRIARGLNAHGVRYAVVGGFAMAYHGLARSTEDIDLLVDPAPDNVERIRRALSVLADRAVLEVEPGDLERYEVVRVADEVIVDLMASACGVSLADVEADVETAPVGGEPVRFLSARSLLRTKQTLRPKDAPDRAHLERVLEE